MIYETNDHDHMGMMKRLIDHRSASMLDVGAGVCRISGDFQVPLILALEAHRPYLENRTNRSPHIIPLHMDALKMEKVLLPKTVSSVLIADVIEHVTKKEGLELLRQAEVIAVNRVVVFTPSGYFPQDGYDYYNMNGEYYQTHRSGWTPEEFDRMGYTVIVLKGLHGPENPSFVKAFGAEHPRTDAIIAYKEFPA
ncbi:hypothetical protein [Gorillibacterium sp. sgz5001074]|uniref:hypothetical protein n=1 Tax=Gorillibacterium sp. sgz5001074 TaxID=3446695 RepID=UPI003F665A0A